MSFQFQRIGPEGNPANADGHSESMQQRESNSQPSDLESDALPLRHAAYGHKLIQRADPFVMNVIVKRRRATRRRTSSVASVTVVCRRGRRPRRGLEPPGKCFACHGSPTIFMKSKLGSSIWSKWWEVTAAADYG